MEPNETPMGPEELRPEPQKPKKKRLLPYVVCCLATAVVVFALTLAGMMLLQSRQKSTSGDDYLAKVQEVVALLDARYVDGLDHTKLGDELAAAAVSATGDRWSYYISAGELAAYQEQNANAYVGIGVTIRLENEDDAGFTVASVTPGGPAEAAGLQIGDMLLAIDGANMKELGMEEARNRVRGEEGTSLTLTVQRGGETFDVTVTRATIEVEVVRAELLDGGVGYLKINNFDSGCAEKSIAAIESLQEQGATSLLFDVRFNPGGHKDELVELLDYLLPEGPLFRSVDYKGNEDIDYSDASWRRAADGRSRERRFLFRRRVFCCGAAGIRRRHRRRHADGRQGKLSADLRPERRLRRRCFDRPLSDPARCNACGRRHHARYPGRGR